MRWRGHWYRLFWLERWHWHEFEPPAGHTHTDVLLEAHKLRVERGDANIERVHLADAIEALVLRSQASLSEDRSPKNPY